MLHVKLKEALHHANTRPQTTAHGQLNVKSYILLLIVRPLASKRIYILNDLQKRQPALSWLPFLYFAFNLQSDYDVNAKQALFKRT
jgi:hypothetical protein